MRFASTLLRWYSKHKRDLPWRKTKDPYLIWLSEIILQQTRVNQGLPYFLKFRKKFPSVKKLAAAKQEEVLKLWQGLGYYSRARNLHEAAKSIVKNFGGKFPSEHSELLKLKGVGEYTAAAIASISFGKPHPVVDGNVVRVLSRNFGIKDTLASAPGKKKFTALAYKLMGKHPPSEFNQAMMEFGALQCVPKNPACGNCPLRKSCYAFRNSLVEILPVKKSKPKIRERFFDYFVIQCSNKILLKKRKGRDIWKNLYDFPLSESKRFPAPDALKKSDCLKRIFGSSNIELKLFGEAHRHVLSYQHLHARFWKVKQINAGSGGNFDDLALADLRTIKKFPFPRLIERFLEANNVFDD
ncbi:MAG TPA: A/G-specific adenine glycosylase [Bacteroidia bacterium]|nr:A/G-specific adenine glycosylase [Bacteroidia bacterium]